MKTSKKVAVIVSIVCGLYLAFVGSAWSLTINGATTDVGFQDSFLFSTRLTNSSNLSEINWVNSVLFTSFTEQDKYDTVANDWTQVDGNTGIYALELIDNPMYILIKIGTGGLETAQPSHFLFQNNEEYNWTVIALTDLCQNPANFQRFGVGRISHVGEFGETQVPEPSTLLLLGSGLLGFGIFARRRKK